MTYKCDPIGFVTPEQWMRSLWYSDTITASILSEMKWADCPLPNNKTRQVIHFIVHRLLLEAISDPEKLLANAGMPDQKDIERAAKTYGNPVPIFALDDDLGIDDEFKESGSYLDRSQPEDDDGDA